MNVKLAWIAVPTAEYEWQEWIQTTRQANMGSSDDITPVTKGFDDNIQQQVDALSSVSFHWKLQECVGGISVGY